MFVEIIQYLILIIMLFLINYGGVISYYVKIDKGTINYFVIKKICVVEAIKKNLMEFAKIKYKYLLKHSYLLKEIFEALLNCTLSALVLYLGLGMVFYFWNELIYKFCVIAILIGLPVVIKLWPKINPYAVQIENKLFYYYMFHSLKVYCYMTATIWIFNFFIFFDLNLLVNRILFTISSDLREHFITRADEGVDESPIKFPKNFRHVVEVERRTTEIVRYHDDSDGRITSHVTKNVNKTSQEVAAELVARAKEESKTVSEILAQPIHNDLTIMPEDKTNNQLQDDIAAYIPLDEQEDFVVFATVQEKAAEEIINIQKENQNNLKDNFLKINKEDFATMNKVNMDLNLLNPIIDVNQKFCVAVDHIQQLEYVMSDQEKVKKDNLIGLSGFTVLDKSEDVKTIAEIVLGGSNVGDYQTLGTEEEIPGTEYSDAGKKYTNFLNHRMIDDNGGSIDTMEELKKVTTDGLSSDQLVKVVKISDDLNVANRFELERELFEFEGNLYVMTNNKCYLTVQIGIDYVPIQEVKDPRVNNSPDSLELTSSSESSSQLKSEGSGFGLLGLIGTTVIVLLIIL